MKWPDTQKFLDWCARNNMVVNVPKTKAMFIASQYAANKILENSQSLKLANETIHISTNEKLLGVHIDSTLSWTTQVESSIKKCNSLLHLGHYFLINWFTRNFSKKLSRGVEIKIKIKLPKLQSRKIKKNKKVVANLFFFFFSF